VIAVADDFAKMVELLDKHDGSFLSVTQQFNTKTSMGRLTLNVLLSFAQFEREGKVDEALGCGPIARRTANEFATRLPHPGRRACGWTAIRRWVMTLAIGNYTDLVEEALVPIMFTKLEIRTRSALETGPAE